MADRSGLHLLFMLLNRKLEYEGAPPLFGPDASVDQTIYAALYLLWKSIDQDASISDDIDIRRALSAAFEKKEAA